ncbi:MAG: transcriptional regulator, partial [Candidatus Methanomethylophilaceae archaeon]|nr:transcriptional regulator [Candidatus Methanomethylophilaceae archaeon]
AKEMGSATFRAVVLEPNDMNVPLGLEKTAERWGLHSLDDVRIIEGSKHPFIEMTTVLVPDEEVKAINKRLKDAI